MIRASMRVRAGVVLLDVLCAMTVLAVAGVGLVSQVAATLRSERTAGASEEMVRRMDQLLRVHALLTGAELRARTGDRAYGALRVNVRPLPGGLYQVTVLLGDDNDPALSTILLSAERAP